MARIVPVILCGGSGTRLWPLSRASLPKQFLRLLSERTLLQDTVSRLGTQYAPPIVVCNDEHRFLAAEQLREIDCKPQAILLEPAGRNTAPAIAAAALLDPEATLFVLPSDHYIGDEKALHSTIARAASLAAEGKLVVFGVTPTAPETAYGYIKPGKGGRVEKFVEKPKAALAEKYIRDGYLWNSGMFVFSARSYLEELETHQPKILSQMQKAVASASRDLDFVRLDRDAFLASPSDSIDYAVMEKTNRAAVVQARFAWSDIGSFQALWETARKDAAGNVVRGDVLSTATKDSYLHSDGRLLTVIGVKDLLVIETGDAVLVAARECSQEIKQAVERLREKGRTEHLAHERVYRPWGYYESLDAGERYQVKRIMVNPRSKISLQKHRQRAEHWVVVSGKARVTHGDKVFELGANQSTYIPAGGIHRLENAGTEPLYVIEVQSGDYLGEDDIERFADDYKRD